MSSKIEVFENLAVISINGTYEMEDMFHILDFLRSKQADTINSFLYRCEKWERVNILGGELFLVSEGRDVRQVNFVFCGLSDFLKGVLTDLAEGWVEPVFCETFNEGLSFIKTNNR